MKNVYRFVFPALLWLFSHTSHGAEKIIIDADTGVDDAMAIILAMASPELELIGITTTFGNADINTSTRNALYLAKRFGNNVDVARGSPVPLVAAPSPPADFVHGKNGLGDIAIDTSDLGEPVAMSAAQYIIEQSLKYPGELTLVPIGRLTNIALALRLDPTLPTRIKQVVLMGGAYAVPGNVTPVAEANIIGDPDAADIVFGAGWDIVALGLDVTTQLTVNNNDLTKLAKRNPDAGQFIKDIAQFYLAFYRSTGLTSGFYVHDPSTILYLLEPSLFTTKQAAVRVATSGLASGATIAAFPPLDTRTGEWFEKPKSNIAFAVNSKKAINLFMERLTDFAAAP